MKIIFRALLAVLNFRNQNANRERIGMEVVRLVDIAIHHHVNPAPWIEQLAGDYTGSVRASLHRIAREFASGESPVGAFHAAPHLFSVETLWAFGVAEQSRTLEQTFHDHLDRRDFANASHFTSNDNSGFFGRLISVFIGLNIWIFVMLFIVPTFEVMFDDFGMKLPTITLMLIAFSGWMAGYWFLFVFAFLVYAMVRIVLSQSDWFNHLVLPLFSRSLQQRRQACLLRSLANVIECGRDREFALSTLVTNHPNSSLRRRHVDSQTSQSFWNRLCSLELITKREAHSLSRLPDPAGVAWFMRRLADLRDFEGSSKLSIFSTLWATFQTLVLAFLVAALCLALYLPLVALISGLT